MFTYFINFKGNKSNNFLKINLLILLSLGNKFNNFLKINLLTLLLKIVR
jgi:hypothetical protein